MKGKIGIFLHGQNGDIMTAMSVLKYREQLWPDKDLVWFVNAPNSDALKHQDIEIRPFAHGWGYPERCTPEGPDNVRAREMGLPAWEDWSSLKTKDNRLHQQKKLDFELTKDLEDGYFPAPYELTPKQRHGIDYPNCSRKVFGVNPSIPWHPVLEFSEEEIDRVNAFIRFNLLKRGKVIMVETFAGSGQSKLTHEMVMETMRICRERLGLCTFLFCSDKYLRDQPLFPVDMFQQEDVYSLRDFTVRECGMFINHCDLFIGVSSGISVSTSHWGSKPVPKLQYCGSFICSTVTLATGAISLVTTDDNPLCEQQYFSELKILLEKI